MTTSNIPYHHGDLRYKLIASTLDIIGEHGADSLTMADIGRSIGVSRTAAYKHFKNKHDLLCAVAEEGFKTIAQRYQDVVDEKRPNALDTLEALGRVYVEFALENPALYRLMFGSFLTRDERPASMREAAREAFDHLPATVARCQEQGHAWQGGSLALASVLWSAVHGLSCLLIDGQLQEKMMREEFHVQLIDSLGRQCAGMDGVVDLLVEVLFRGLGTGPRNSED